MFCLSRYLSRSFSDKQASYQQFAQGLSEPKKYEFEQKLRSVQAEILALEQPCSSYNPLVGLGRFYKAWGTWNNLIALDDMTKAHWWQQSIWSQSWFSIGITLLFIFVVRHFIFGLYCTPTGSAEPNILVGDRILGVKYPYFFKSIERGDLVIFDQPNFVYDEDSVVNKFWQKYVGIGFPILGLPNGPEAWVKRVIGIPGDVVEGRIEDGKTVVYRNGEKLEELYTNPYPLITITREIGFAKSDWGLPVVLNKSTVGERGELKVTYNPELAYDAQPFYNFTEDETLKDSNGAIMEHLPKSPSRGDVFGPMKVPVGKIWCMGDNRKNSDDCRSWGFLDSSLVVGRASRILFSVDSHEAWWIFDLIKHPINFFTKHLRYSRFGRSLHPFVKVYNT